MGLGVTIGQTILPVPYLQMSLPAEFTSRWTPAFRLFESASGAYLSDLDYAALKPAIAKSYYVRSDGSDAAAGTVGAPLLSLSAALAKSDVDAVVIDCSGGDYIMRGSRGWNNTQASRSLSVRVIGPGRAISVASGSTTAPTWTLHAGNIYKCTIAAAEASSVIDLANREGDGFYQRLASVGSVGVVVAGTYYHDGTDLYVRAFDSRSLIGDERMAPCSTSNNARIPSASRTTFIEGIEFVGGAPLIYVATGAVDPLVVAIDCSFQGSRTGGGGAQDNVTITGPGRFYFRRCGSARANRDAFNYHGNANGDPRIFEDECWTGLSGYVGPSDNASTSHENSAIIRLNGRYRGALNRTVIDINDVRALLLGCQIGQARTIATSNEGLSAADTAKTWVAGSSFESGGNPQISIIGAAAVVAYRRMPAPGRAGTGEDTGTLTSW
jgi:hypothetical protein